MHQEGYSVPTFLAERRWVSRLPLHLLSQNSVTESPLIPMNAWKLFFILYFRIFTVYFNICLPCGRFLKCLLILCCLSCLRLSYYRSSVYAYVHGAVWVVGFTVGLSSKGCCFVAGLQMSASNGLFSWVVIYRGFLRHRFEEMSPAASILWAWMAKSLRISPRGFRLPTFWKFTAFLTYAFCPLYNCSRRVKFQIFSGWRRYNWLSGWQAGRRVLGVNFLKIIIKYSGNSKVTKNNKVKILEILVI